jgi:hypothetical protein
MCLASGNAARPTAGLPAVLSLHRAPAMIVPSTELAELLEGYRRFR